MLVAKRDQEDEEAEAPGPDEMVPPGHKEALLCMAVAGGVPDQYFRLYYVEPRHQVYYLNALQRAAAYRPEDHPDVEGVEYDE